MNKDNGIDVIVVGGGASGLFAAGSAAAAGARVVLIEKGERLARKLLITGKGRCNLTNAECLEEFITNYGDNGKFLYRAFHEFFNNDLIEFFKSYGVETKVERGGRVFPVSDRAETIVSALERYARDNGVEIWLSTRVSAVAVDEKGRIRGVKVFAAQNDAAGVKLIKSRAVILATGGLSYPVTGSTGDGYAMARKVGHSIEPLLPALVGLETSDSFVKRLQGLTLKNVRVTVFSGAKEAASGFGEMLFTHFGVSGPVVLRLSGEVAARIYKNEKMEMSVDLKPALGNEQLHARLMREFDAHGLKSFYNVVKLLLPASMVPVFVERSGLPAERQCCRITRKERENVVRLLKDFRFHISRTRPIEEAIVTRGGVNLRQINPRTMESLIVKGLYLCGEVIDIDGVTGGYNLQAAFSSARLAGVSAAQKGESS